MVVPTVTPTELKSLERLDVRLDKLFDAREACVSYIYFYGLHLKRLQRRECGTARRGFEPSGSSLSIMVLTR